MLGETKSGVFSLQIKLPRPLGFSLNYGRSKFGGGGGVPIIILVQTLKVNTTKFRFCQQIAAFIQWKSYRMNKYLSAFGIVLTAHTAAPQIFSDIFWYVLWNIL